ncbi:mucin-2-like [Latimeria chalumnae]|uniref:mucin-2-like n=1 Tax=Latimeria chalumnae TaxID=7897 RepID=UPI00313EBD25
MHDTMGNSMLYHTNGKSTHNMHGSRHEHDATSPGNNKSLCTLASPSSLLFLIAATSSVGHLAGSSTEQGLQSPSGPDKEPTSLHDDAPRASTPQVSAARGIPPHQVGTGPQPQRHWSSPTVLSTSPMATRGRRLQDVGANTPGAPTTTSISTLIPIPVPCAPQPRTHTPTAPYRTVPSGCTHIECPPSNVCTATAHGQSSVGTPTPPDDLPSTSHPLHTSPGGPTTPPELLSDSSDDILPPAQGAPPPHSSQGARSRVQAAVEGDYYEQLLEATLSSSVSEDALIVAPATGEDTLRGSIPAAQRVPRQGESAHRAHRRRGG